MLSCSTVLLLALSNKKVFLCVGPLAPLGFYPHTSGGLAAKVSFWSLSPIRSPPAPGKAAKVSSWSLSPIRSPSAPLGSAVLLSLNTYVTDATICRGPAPLLRPLLKVRIPSQLSLDDCYPVNDTTLKVCCQVFISYRPSLYIQTFSSYVIVVIDIKYR